MTNAYYTFAYYTLLPNRSAVAVTGPDAIAFLQGLLTQDMSLLEHKNVTYSALLTPQGKIDFDFFVWKHGDGVLLECEGHRAEVLLQRLHQFKLRRNISLNTVDIQVVAMWGDADALKVFPYESDPRHVGLGLRKIILQPLDKNDFNGAQEVESNFYYRLCMGLGVPNGSRDIAIGEDTVADVNLDKLNGVSYTKGCYMGQELTSRMYHRGLAKKGLYAVTIDGDALPPFTDITVDNNLIGEMRSSDGDIGLAVLRHDSLKAAAKIGIIPPETDFS
jgi:hypothetical protein